MPRTNKKDKDLEDEEFFDNEPPKDVDPYEILGLEKTATADEVKKAYRKAALVHHPDKAKEEDKATAHTTFQRIALAYAVLSSPARRARYDATGRTDESLFPGDDDDDGPFDWLSFYRSQFADVVTESAINNVKSEYQGSEEEKEAVLAAYERYKGNMVQIYQVIMLSEMLVDEDRFRVIIDEAIQEGRVKGFKKYTEESESARKKRMDAARKQKAKQEKEWEAEMKKKEGKDGKGKAAKVAPDGGMGDLAALIQQRQKARAGGASFFDHLEQKYAPRGKKRQSEPPEEAFAAGRAEAAALKRGKRTKIVADEESDDAVEEPKPAGRRSGRKKG